MILYFNGPIESVDDDNEKDNFFPLFAHESDSSRGTSSQTKRRRRDIFLLGRHHQFTRRKSFVWNVEEDGGAQFLAAVTPVSLFFYSLLSLFYYYFSSMLLVYTQSKLVPLLHFPSSSSPYCNELARAPSVFFFFLLPVVVPYWE